MKITTTFQTLIVTAAHNQHDLIKRAEVTCGDLGGAYSYLQAPVCSGQTSICTFSGNYQGCCDSASKCQYYHTCDGPYASSPCTGSTCLTCPTSAPNCLKYNLEADGQQYEAYSCALFPNPPLTIYGIARSAGATASITSSSVTSRSTSSSTNTLSSSSITSSPTRSSAGSSMPTATAAPASDAKPSSHAGAIAGGTIGGIAAIALLALLYVARSKGWGRKRASRARGPEIQQRYGGGESIRSYPSTATH